jgi:SagB-type dehydrogenase family enzyme
LEGETSLEETLSQRRSVRSFQPRSLTLDEISQLLWALQGITDPRGFRTAPSAGALYPLEVYLVLPEGWHHYQPQEHRLERMGDEDLRQALWAAGIRQESLRDAPAVFVITAVIDRTRARYGERAERYVHMEAGHAAQNLLLQATALGLGAVTIGAFDDAEVSEALHLPGDRTPLYLIPIGEPRTP